MAKDINKKLTAFLKEVEKENTLKAEAEEADVVAANVIKALTELGINEDMLKASLVDANIQAEEDDEKEEMEEMEEMENEMEDEMEAKVVAGVLKVLEVMGLNVENDVTATDEMEEETEAMDEDEMDEDELKEIGNLVSNYLSKHQSVSAASKLTSQLTASMNLAVIATAQRSQDS